MGTGGMAEEEEVRISLKEYIKNETGKSRTNKAP